MNRLKESLEILGACLALLWILTTGEFSEFIDGLLEALNG